jgi:hypothetical protein
VTVTRLLALSGLLGSEWAEAGLSLSEPTAQRDTSSNDQDDHDGDDQNNHDRIPLGPTFPFSDSR